MDNLTVITGNSEDIARGLKILIESYNAAKIKTIVQVNEDHERLTTREAANFANVSFNTFYKWLNTGKIRFYGTKKTRFYYKSELEEDLKKLR